jgi:SWI/SNF-related matrix-associated actin-dependent regulator of chromatin subfamily A3
VFSTWRLSLDIVKTALDEASIPSIRFDGKVPQKDRQAVVERFRNDPSIRVMLLTISCGAVGYGSINTSPICTFQLASTDIHIFDSLTLTAASRAYLMEPHW